MTPTLVRMATVATAQLFLWIISTSGEDSDDAGGYCRGQGLSTTGIAGAKVDDKYQAPARMRDPG